ncbi:transmembrane protein 222 [Ixodes scapularis]
MFSAAGDTSDKASVLADEMPSPAIDFARDRFPFCIVWTPIPCMTWFFPFLGHMGICTSSGIIRDFAGPYYVSEDHMAFGRPTRYWPLNPSKARDGVQGWDRAVAQASDEYKGRMHNLFCDNCHSHVAKALNNMNYGGRSNWNMVKVAFLMLIRGKFVSTWGLIRTWLPFLIVICLAFALWLSLSVKSL